MTGRNVFKVGELAKRTGVSVRTLHHYDGIGLLSPSHRTDAGHRLYAEADILRLQQIKSLRQLGLSLNEIRDLLNRRAYSAQQVIRLHIGRLREQIAVQQQLYKRLEIIAERLDSDGEVSVDELITAIKEVNMTEKFEKYYTPEQLKKLEERKKAVGEDRIRQVEMEWKELIEQVRTEMKKGTDPQSETARGLAERWMGLIDEFTGGDSGILESLTKMYQAEPNIASDRGFTPEPDMMAFIGSASKKSK